jgi:hypothetical protein
MLTEETRLNYDTDLTATRVFYSIYLVNFLWLIQYFSMSNLGLLFVKAERSNVVRLLQTVERESVHDFHN